MALDTLKRIGKSGAVGLLGKNLRRVAGNVGAVIRGDVGGPDSSTSAPINRTKQSTKMLSFPIDVGADPGIGNNGHYVMFFINEQKNLKLSFGDETAKPEGAMNMAKALQQKGIPAVQKMFDSKLGSFVQKAIPNLLSNNIRSGFTDIIGIFTFAFPGFSPISPSNGRVIHPSFPGIISNLSFTLPHSR